MKAVEELVKKINSNKFSGLEMYDVGSALPIMATNVYFETRMSVKNKLWSIIQWVLFDTVEYEYVNKNSDVLTIYSDERIKRTDYNKVFSNVNKTLDSDTITAHARKGKKLHNLVEVITNIRNAIQWMHQLRKCDMNFRNSIRVITDITRIYNIHKYLEAATFSHKNCIIVFCDIFPTDNICVQFFRQIGAVTLTLQHAAFTAALEKPTNINDTGIELTYSISDYFLGWNQFTKEQALRCGMKEEKFRIVGMPQFIDYLYRPVDKDIHNCFGVILGVKEYDDVNRKVIKVANEIAEKYRLNYYLKYHPNFQGDEYSDITNVHCLGNFTLTDMGKYVESVDFSILSVTSMFVELVFLEHDIYRYKIDPDKDKFNQISIFSFSNLDEFSAIYNQSQKGFFDYLCYTRHVGESYHKVVQSLLTERSMINENN